MISVIIPARNAAGTIGVALASLAGDKPLICEILLIDDGSDDDTSEVAQKAAEQHGLPLVVISVQFANIGAARNAGLERVAGEYVFFLDSDDEIVAGALTLLHQALKSNPSTGIAVGAFARRTSGRPDNLKLPSKYTDDCGENARRYLRNAFRSIAIGSALFAIAAVRDIRFPTTNLDEDTCYWAAILTRLQVATIDDLVLIYNFDEGRMIGRFVGQPRATILNLSLQYNKLQAFGIGRDAVQRRKAWHAQRIVRVLLKQQRYEEAASLMRMVRAHARLRWGLRSIHYNGKIGTSLFARKHRLNQPAQRPSFITASDELSRGTLIITGDPAYPPISGADLRNYQNAKAASQFGPVLLTSLQPSRDAAPVEGPIRIAALARRNEAPESSLVQWRTSAELRIGRPALLRLLALVRTFRPDTIIVEGVGLSALLDDLRPFARRLILDMHNIESALAPQLRARRLRQQLLPRRWTDGSRIERLERRALDIVDRVWVCSDIERDRLQSMFAPSIPIDVVPNGLPRAEAIPADLPALAGKDEGWPVLVFVGHLGYAPNVVAAERLATAILPLVRQTLPSAKLILAGRDPKPAVVALASLPGVELAADFADVSQLFLRSHIAVVPLCAGGGTRIKILEAMAWGLPVVSSAIAAEGLGFTTGKEILIADTNEAFAQSVVVLSKEPERFERQRGLAYETARLRFGPSAIEDAVRRGLGRSNAE